jgi:MFS superfamily sulfate permease-like transporter
MATFQNLKQDLPASIVVFLVAVPLCLGIALASGAPLFAGIISGIIGGLIIGALSGSQLSVSGPAAGLTAVVLNGQQTLGSFEALLVATALAGLIQLVLGFIRAGSITAFFPSPVIKGMLAGIGLIIIFKQIPHAVGYDADWEGDLSFMQEGGTNTLTALGQMFNYVVPGALVIGLISFAIMLVWRIPALQRLSFFKNVPAPLVVVIVGILAKLGFDQYFTALAIADSHLVELPVASSGEELAGLLRFPDFGALTRVDTYVIAFTIAIVASLETLLCIDAIDKIDPERRVSPPNRELRAQGVGNLLSGLIGGLPITSVIVRSSTNLSFGAKTKLSAILHGAFLLLTVLLIPNILNLIPLASLAAILIMVGYNLTNPALYQDYWRKGFDQFLPFAATAFAIFFTDLLTGIGIGLAVGLFFVIKTNYHSAIQVSNQGKNYLISFKKDVSFLNKNELQKALDSIPENAYLLIDGRNAQYIDSDIYEMLDDFQTTAQYRNIQLEMQRLRSTPNHLFTGTKTKNQSKELDDAQ